MSVNKTVVWSVAIVAMAAVICVSIYAHADRFHIAMSGKIAYKIDRHTGQSWLLHGKEEVAIGKSTPVDETVDQKAVRLCKEAHTLDHGEYSLSNDLGIREWVRETKGPLKIIGWKARRIDEETFW